MQYKAVFLIVTALILSLGAGCGGADSDGSLTLVPQGADMVGHISISQILSDSDLIGLYDALPKDPEDPQTFDAALDALKAQTGIGLRVFDELLIFGDVVTGLDDVGYLGVIGKGTFDTASFISDIEDAADLDLVQTARGEYDIYADQEADAAVALLDEETVVIGTISAVTDVIDVRAGDAPSIDGEVMDLFGGLGNVLVKLAASAGAVATEEALSGITGALPVPIDLSSLVDIETTGLTFTRDGQSIAMEIEFNFANSNSASDAKGLVSMVKAFINMYGVPEGSTSGIPIPAEGQALIPRVLTELEAEVIDSDLVISLTMTFEEIEELLSEQ